MQKEPPCISGAVAARTTRKSTAAELGISHCFTGFLAKPTHIVDDQHITQWRDLVHLHPSQDFDA